MGDSSETSSKKKSDILFVHSPAPKGEGYRVLRMREDRVEVGTMTDVKEGEPIHGEVVRLKPRRENARLFDVETLVSREDLEPAGVHPGPAHVASEAYRQNWESIFGSRKRGKPGAASPAAKPKRELLN